MYQINFKRKAGKELLKLPSQAVKEISSSIDALAENPRPDGSKKLKGSNESLWRIRVGDYRVIYAIEDKIKIISVRRIAHRKDIYR
ncbi:MAG: type II toxin-antitoxin system RelE/ParE family toxin [Imperialibacter sp.]|uniref:type II toxin-antitoxin system RelE family toxin n=1 Tax=Imperialibacter sp. TaxID=2038411 RepID=UPI0032F06017